MLLVLATGLVWIDVQGMIKRKRRRLEEMF